MLPENTQFSAAVIGLGRIGQGFDYDLPEANVILTHAKAFSSHPGFQLAAGVDPNPQLRAEFEKKYKVPAFESISKMREQFSPDVYSVAVPAESHLGMIKELLITKPKAVVCEKPLAPSLEETLELVELCEKSRCLLAANYIRRFDPGVIEVRERIRKGEIGKIYKGTVWYSKGIQNNGSHFIDLLHFLLGPSTEIELLNPGRDLNCADPEPDVRICFGDAVIYLLSGREEDFSVKELTLMGTGGVFSYRMGGRAMTFYHPKKDTLFAGYKIISDEGISICSEFPRYQYHVVDALYNTLNEKTPLNSDGTTSLQTARTVEEILKQLRNGIKNHE